MLTLAPVPRWRDLARALRGSAGDGTLPWRGQSDTAGWLSRSAWSLALVASWRRRLAPERPVVAWLPDFFCNGALAPLRATGARLVFYPLTDDLAPDLGACKELAKTSPPDLLVVVHYFGKPTPLAASRDFATRHGAWIVEDAAHVLRRINGVGDLGDFVLYSPHKHLPVPDGAVLVARVEGSARLSADAIASFGTPDTWPAQARRAVAGAARSAGAWKWLAKRIAQRAGVGRAPRGWAPFDESRRAPGGDGPLPPPEHTPLARRLLAPLLSQLGIEARERSQMLWDHRVASEFAGTVTPAARPRKREWTPYLAAYAVDQSSAAAVYDQWRARSWPVTVWPDLPPEVTAAPANHARAWSLRHSRLYLPVHAAVAASDFAVPRGGAASRAVRMTRDEVSEAEWTRLLTQAGRSNLLQGWAYGEAKAATSPWSAHRLVFHKDAKPIAIAQVLERRIARAITVLRVNRAPLMLGPVSAEDEASVWEMVASLGSAGGRRVLSIAPDRLLSGDALADLSRLGFHQPSPVGSWESVWIDLRPELDELRRRLDGKWRNMLVAAEKAGLTLEYGSDDRLFDWMMERYVEVMSEKGFSGASVEFLRAYRRLSSGGESPIVLRAMHEGQAVSGICVARHGAAATYLIGWNGDAGRRLKANQFLLWNAVVRLKAMDLTWFDLGGINEERTPGIAAFKLGMGGERYELVGEYWKW